MSAKYSTLVQLGAMKSSMRNSMYNGPEFKICWSASQRASFIFFLFLISALLFSPVRITNIAQ